MNNHIKLLAVILGISCLCGCNNELGVGNLNDLTTEPHLEIADYSEIKEGYYLSDSGDGSYYIIKDGKFSLINYDWEKAVRERNQQGNMTSSEYEEYTSEEVREAIEMYVNKSFIPVKYCNYSTSYPYMMLVSNIKGEEILEDNSNKRGIYLIDENTIGLPYEPPFYVYCGTSLPDNVQTQTSD